jgi:hypothetical protein
MNVFAREREKNDVSEGKKAMKINNFDMVNLMMHVYQAI